MEEYFPRTTQFTYRERQRAVSQLTRAHPTRLSNSLMLLPPPTSQIVAHSSSPHTIPAAHSCLPTHTHTMTHSQPSPADTRQPVAHTNLPHGLLHPNLIVDGHDRHQGRLWSHGSLQVLQDTGNPPMTSQLHHPVTHHTLRSIRPLGCTGR